MVSHGGSLMRDSGRIVRVRDGCRMVMDGSSLIWDGGRMVKLKDARKSIRMVCSSSLMRDGVRMARGPV